ncbi:MAG: hypothetical protein JF612_01775, partial [Planctomycetia bacterium]|nr:hypothetical protein [Planctomycetia bacterium]
MRASFLTVQFLTLAIIGDFVASPLLAADNDEVVLFNGKNFDGWTAFISRPGVQREDIWSVKEGGV